jgi:hypothetical protein
VAEYSARFLTAWTTRLGTADAFYYQLMSQFVDRSIDADKFKQMSKMLYSPSHLAANVR